MLCSDIVYMCARLPLPASAGWDIKVWGSLPLSWTIKPAQMDGKEPGQRRVGDGLIRGNKRRSICDDLELWRKLLASHLMYIQYCVFLLPASIAGIRFPSIRIAVEFCKWTSSNVWEPQTAFYSSELFWYGSKRPERWMCQNPGKIKHTFQTICTAQTQSYRVSFYDLVNYLNSQCKTKIFSYV